MLINKNVQEIKAEDVTIFKNYDDDVVAGVVYKDDGSAGVAIYDTDDLEEFGVLYRISNLTFNSNKTLEEIADSVFYGDGKTYISL
tara:strand:+ start:669 stop:926 length:258 start_codon:yes stop_codon:yes gene_type:complete